MVRSVQIKESPVEFGLLAVSTQGIEGCTVEPRLLILARYEVAHSHRVRLLL
jgi:hypothetical protein